MGYSSEEKPDNSKNISTQQSNESETYLSVTNEKNGNYPDGNADNKGDITDNRIINRRLDWVACFTLLLTIVTAIQCYAFIQSQRAFLVLDSIAITSPENASPIEIAIIVKNGGRSGAQGTIYTTARFKSLADIPDYTDVSANGLPPIIESGNARNVISIPLPPDVFIADIASGETPLNIYGYVSYTDDFSLFGGKSTGFCATYNPHGNPAVSAFNACKQHQYYYAR